MRYCLIPDDTVPFLPLELITSFLAEDFLCCLRLRVLLRPVSFFQALKLDVVAPLSRLRRKMGGLFSHGSAGCVAEYGTRPLRYAAHSGDPPLPVPVPLKRSDAGLAGVVLGLAAEALRNVFRNSSPLKLAGGGR